MNVLSMKELSAVVGGEIVPGTPSPDMFALLAKMMVAAGRGEPGFDVSVAASLLIKYAGVDFPSRDAAIEYARHGGLPG